MTKPITCIITDDEPMARKGLEGYVRRSPSLTLSGSCEDAFALKRLLSTQSVDLLFLDIEMPQLSGIELLRSLQNPPKVIFTTAYEEFALTGFELDVLDYLLKPISFERFSKAVDKAVDYFSHRSSDDAIFIKVNGSLEKLSPSDIVYVEALENYVAFYTNRGEKLVTHATLKSVAQTIPILFQSHKSFLVNPKKISALRDTTIIAGIYNIPISRSRITALKKVLLDYGILLNE